MSRCVFINSLEAGGAERVLSSLYNNGYEADFFLQIWPSKFYKIKGGNQSSLLDKKGFILFDLLLSFFKLYYFVRKNNISSINSHLFWANYLNSLVSKLTNHKVVCTHCVSLKSKFSSKLVYCFHYFMIKFSFSKNTIHTFKSMELEEEYLNTFKFENSVTIFNPYKEIESVNQANLKLSPDKTYFICVGRFHRTKRQCDIIKSLVNVNENVVVVFAGDGPELNACKELVVKLELSEKVIFLGKVSNIFPYYKIIDNYISSSYSEGFPNALIEAISCDCFPIHTSCKTGPKEIITSFNSDVGYSLGFNNYIYDLGILVPVNDLLSLSKSIDFVHKNKPKLNEERVNVLKKKLEIDEIVKQYNDILGSI